MRAVLGRCRKCVVSGPQLGLVIMIALNTPLAGQSLPTPESVLGFRPGADFRLATYEESVDYFQRLDAASDRMMMMMTGRTSEGRTWYIAVISTPDNLANLEQHKETAARFARPASLSDEEARTLASSAKAIVDINGGLHATEVAGAQHMIQLAYDLVAGEDRRTRAIRENVITVLWPSLNPDGQTMVAEWYRSNVGTPYEVPSLPRLYQKYVGHDNNRDAYMLNMVESRVLARTWRECEPQIIYVHHQKAPFPTRIWLPPFAEPIATYVPRIMTRQVNMIGMAIAQLLESRGQVGATHMGTGFDSWYPGYVDYMPMLQNQVAFWTETGLYRYATPHFYTLADFPESRRDLRPESLYPSPWAGGWWRLGDAVDYMLTGSMATLDYAAKYREDLLFNRYQSGRDVIRKYRERPPLCLLRLAGSAGPGGGGGALAPPGLQRDSHLRADRPRDARGYCVWGGHLDDPDGPRVRGARAPGSCRAGIPGFARLSGWSAGAAVRCGRVDAPVSDGREGGGGHGAPRG